MPNIVIHPFVASIAGIFQVFVGRNLFGRVVGKVAGVRAKSVAFAFFLRYVVIVKKFGGGESYDAPPFVAFSMAGCASN